MRPPRPPNSNTDNIIIQDSIDLASSSINPLNESNWVPQGKTKRLPSPWWKDEEGFEKVQKNVRKRFKVYKKLILYFLSNLMIFCFQNRELKKD